MTLLALRIGARLSKELEVSINAGMVMEHCTVARLAGAVDELLDGRGQSETEALLDMVENLSEEDAAAVGFYGVNRDLKSLARDLLERGRKDDARFYVLTDRSRRRRP